MGIGRISRMAAGWRRHGSLCLAHAGFAGNRNLEWDTVKSVVLRGSNALELSDEFPEPELRPGTVKVKMLAGGVCGSDLSVIHGHRAIPGYPWIIGHEGGGVVTDTAADVAGLVSGDRVVIEPNFSCGKCSWCLRGETKMCENRIILGINSPGVFSEYVVIPAAFAWKVPDDTPKAVLASFEPSVVAHVAVERYLGLGHKDVLVVGAGSQGLIVTALLAQNGYQPAVSEPNEEKLAAAIRHGGTDLREAPASCYDLVFETSGVPAGLQTALNRAGKLGTLCVIGQTNRPTEVVSQNIVQKELKINGQLIYNHPVDFRSAVASLANGTLDPTIALREPVGVSQGIADILSAAELGGKIWLDLEDWA
jgi:threonine dehydrogenase-like Zn-dependent dehydrogenase